MKEGLPFPWDLSLENSADSYLCFRLALLHSVSYFFFLYQSPCSALCTVFDSISSNIDEVLSINPSANVFVFEDFNIRHKDWLTYSGGTELCYNFSPTTLLNSPTQIPVSYSVSNFPTQIPDCDSHTPALLDLFLSSYTSMETLTSIIRTGFPIPVELIDLVNSVINFLSQMTLLTWLIFLLGSQTVILIVLLFWIYFF